MVLNKWATDRRNNLKIDLVIEHTFLKYKVLWSQKEESRYLVGKGRIEVRKDQKEKKETFVVDLGDRISGFGKNVV